MKQTFYDKVFKEEYAFVNQLKRTEKVEITVWLNKSCEKKLIIKKYNTFVDAYKKLLHVENENLPIVYEVLQDENGTIVLEEFVDGTTVAEILETGLYTESGACDLILQICNGLKVLHGYGMVHRDIKPENIMVDNNGKVKIIDFDVARTIKENADRDTVIMGTIGYAAPEQFGIAQSDERADIYAIGVLLNVVLTGEHPSKNMYGGKLRRVIEKCTRLNPNKRFQSVEELEKKLIY